MIPVPDSPDARRASPLRVFPEAVYRPVRQVGSGGRAAYEPASPEGWCHRAGEAVTTDDPSSGQVIPGWPGPAYADGVPPLVDLSFDPGTLHVVRARMRDCAGHAGLPEGQAENVVLAVHELAANAICHGGGAGRLRVWILAGALHCQVDDGDAPASRETGRRGRAARRGGPRLVGGRAGGRSAAIAVRPGRNECPGQVRPAAALTAAVSGQLWQRDHGAGRRPASGLTTGLAELAAVGGGRRLVGLALLAAAHHLGRLGRGAVVRHPVGAAARGRARIPDPARLRGRRTG